MRSALQSACSKVKAHSSLDTLLLGSNGSVVEKNEKLLKSQCKHQKNYTEDVSFSSYTLQGERERDARLRSTCKYNIKI